MPPSPLPAGPPGAHAGLPQRGDIDGLRAIAVLAVVLFHACPGVLPGGYVGVDIFFAISGYLITGIIAADLAQGRFALLGFYRRRIHRLFPALALVLACTLLAGWSWFTAGEFRQLGHHTLASALFAQNAALWQESGYFDLGSAHKPLLHLWTLAIEEQFYLAYPLLLLALWRLRLHPLTAILLVLLASFAANLLTIAGHPVAAFFSPASRAWELLAGGVVALAQRAGAGSSGGGALAAGRASTRVLLASAGLALISYALRCFDSGMDYPGWRATVPVLGTVLVIASGPATAIHALLGARALAYLGLISYPLYLWHWPLLSVRAIVAPDAASPWLGPLLALGAVGLASATYHGLECRLRTRRTLTTTIGLVAAVALLASLGLLAWHGWLAPRLAASRGAELADQAAHDWGFPGAMRAVPLGGSSCYRAGGSGRTTLFWGDSHMQQYAPRISALVAAYPADGRGALFLTGASVPPLPGIVAPAQPEACAGNERRFRLLASDVAVDIIVIAARWELYLGPASSYVVMQGTASVPLSEAAGRERALANLGALLAELVQGGKTVYLVLDNPGASAFLPSTIYRRSFGGDAAAQAQGISRSAALAAQAAQRDALSALAARSGAHLIDPLAALAHGDAIPALDDAGEPIYMDSNHLRATFVREHVRYLDITVPP